MAGFLLMWKPEYLAFCFKFNHAYLMDQERYKAAYGFATYKNYLTGFSYLIDLLYPDYNSLAPSLKDIQGKPDADTKRIRKLLFNSWNSEALLNLPRFLNEDFIKFSNHWSPVQSYYGLYLATRALIVARGIEAAGTHDATLKICAHNFSDQKIFPEPWNYICCENGTYEYLPAGFIEQVINSQENPYFFRKDRDRLINNYKQFLKTTRDRIIDEKCEDWKSKNPTMTGPRKKLPSGKRSEIDSLTRNISFLDCFYRLRTRSNYKDVDIFILGSGIQDSKNYLDALCNITDKTLFILESYILKSIGTKPMKEIVNQYKAATNISFVVDETAGISKRYRSLFNSNN